MIPMEQVTVERTQKYLIVKIPFKAVKVGSAELSTRARKIIDRAVSEGLRDIAAGRTFGPFATVKEFRKALSGVPRK